MRNMKYFRFLFCETRDCFMHFGELKDANTNERFTFLYLKGTEKLVNQKKKSEHTLFLYPDYIDLVVLGKADGYTQAALTELLEGTEVGTLVVPKQSEGAEMEHTEKIGQIVKLEAGTVQTSYQMAASGWKFFLKCYHAESVVMAHGVDTEELGTSETGCLYNDCVMSVKAMDDEKRCYENDNPDGYGCALGCVLHQDYDVCKHPGESGLMPTGTILLSGEDDIQSWTEIQHDFNSRMKDFRFIGLPERAKGESIKACLAQIPEEKYKRYFIGTKATMEDDTIGSICKNKLYHIAVPLGKEQGICCSGLLNYSSKQG